MHQLYLIPGWFYGYDIVFEIIFGLITLFTAWNAYKVYKASKEKNIRSFGIGFLLVSLSYFVWAIINLFIVSDMGGARVLELPDILVLSTISIYAQIILFITGLALLASSTLKSNDDKLFALLFFISISAVCSASNKFFSTYSIAAILLLFISVHYISEFRRKRNKITGTISIAFSLLSLGTIELLFAGSTYLPYVISHLIILIAYIIILVSLITILKHGKKKKQT